MTQIVTPEQTNKANIMANFYRVIGVYGAIWIIFHLSCVFFFGFIVGSPLLVGIFLGIGNLWSMVIDVPLGTIQRHVPSKNMLLAANILMIIAAIFFLYLVKTSGDLSFQLNGTILENTISFFGSLTHVIVLLIVGILYGTIKEIYDITTISYLLNHNDPSEYDTALSKNNIAMGIGSVVGILISVLVLSLKTDSVQIILFVLIFLIICVAIFIQTYFDNSHEVFDVNAVKNLHLMDKTMDLEKKTESYIKKTLSTADFESVKHTIDYIIMKPKELSREVDWADIYQKTKLEYKMIFRLIFEKKTFVPILLWSTGGILLFGCWDTIVTTFFVDFLDQSLQNAGVQNIIRSGFFLIGILAIPAYMLQMFWIKKASIYGKFRIITLGIFLSAVALLGLAISGNFENLFGLIAVVLLGMLNSTGYAAGYPMSQSIFADEYNKSYAQTTGSTVINADVSAAPLKILNNFANAIGLICGGALIASFGFSGMFVVYGLAVLIWGFFSIRKRIPWKL